MPTFARVYASHNWTILCDFDGTVALVDIVDGLLERHGLAGWQALEEDWRAGRMGSRECMRRQVELLDIDASELNAYLDEQLIDPDFPRFVEAALAKGHTVSIVSDGIDYAIHRILNRHALLDLTVAANRLLPTAAPRRWGLASPFETPNCLCGTCKCAQIFRARAASARQVLLIGDGRSDFCASQSADLVFAKGPLIDYCREKAIPHEPIANFRMATDLLVQLEKFAPS
jgi:2-hydroxy-3-keto-5-methylthiopentenyl-1-phosphate phosphatase